MEMISMAFAGRQKFDGHSHFLCVHHIFSRHFCNAFCIDIFEVHLLAGDQRRKDRDLPAGVIAFHIRLRIALRIPFILRLFEDLVIVRALVKHLCEHIICRSVQDSRDLLDHIRRHRGVQRTDNRDPAAHTGLKEEIDVPLSRDGQKLRPVFCHKRFVGCSHTLARLKTALYKSVCRLDAAHDLYHDPDLRVVYDRLKIMDDLLLDRISREISQIQYIFYIDLIPCSLCDHTVVQVEDFHYT